LVAVNILDLQVAAGVAFALAVFGQAGYLSLRLLTARGSLLRAGETAALSYGLGVGLVTFEMLLFGMAGIRFSLVRLLVPWVLAWLLLFAARLAGRLPGPTRVPPQTKERTRTSLACALLVAGFASLFALLLYRSTFRPVDLWDAVAYWDLKARAFFTDGGIVPFVTDRYYDWAHLDYPQLVPLAGTLVYLCIGAPHEAVQVVPVGFFAALLIQFHGVLRREAAGRLAALVLTAGLALMPNVLFWAYNFGAEAALAYFAFTTAAFFYLFLRTGLWPLFLISALSGAFLTQTKIEGPFLLIPAVVVLVTTAIRSRWAPRPRRLLLLFIGVVGVVALPWFVFQKLGTPYGGFVSAPIATALVQHISVVPVVLRTIVGWAATPDMGAMGLVFAVLGVCVAVDSRAYFCVSTGRYLLGFLVFALVPYILVWTALPRYLEPLALNRFLLVFTVTAHFIVALHVIRVGSSQGRRWAQGGIAAGVGVLVALALSQWAVVSRGPRGIGYRWTFPEGAAAWRPGPACFLETAGRYLKVQAIDRNMCVLDIGDLSLDTTAHRAITIVAKGVSGTATLILVSWQAAGEPAFPPRHRASARVAWSGADQRIEIEPGWHGALKGLRVTLENLGRSWSPLLIRSIEARPRLTSTLAAVAEGGGARSLSVFALAGAFAFILAGMRGNRLVPILAFVWAACAVLTWFLPDLWLGTPPGQLRRPLSLAREIWREAEVYAPASASERVALIEAANGNRDLGESLVNLMETCPEGDVALFLEPGMTDQTDPATVYPAEEGMHTVLRSAQRLYPHRVLVVTQPAKLLRLLRMRAVTRVLAYAREVPPELAQSPNRMVHRGAWGAVCGPTGAPAAMRTRLAAKWNRPPTRASPGVFSPSEQTWELVMLRPRGTRYTNAFAYGGKGDIPVVGDWDGDGVDTVGVYRPSDSRFELRNSNRPGLPDLSVPFGRPGDVPIVGDWDGDGIDKIGVFRPSDAVFYLGGSGADPDSERVRSVIHFGAPGDVPISGDWDGDGIDKIGVYHPATATFCLRASNALEERNVTTVAFGIVGDLPIVGDWDGEGVDRIGVYRPSQQLWFLADSNKTPSLWIRPIAFGRSRDRPVSGAWQGSSWFALE
jgi:hypothetical protein